MPTYSFYNNQTGEQFDEMMKFSEREEYLNSNPHITPVVTAASIVGGVSIKDKVPSGFKEVLSKVAESHKASAVGERYGSKSIKEVRTKNIVDKHYQKSIKS
jgi:predicted nucleic acid-binding Zn ribbon protein